jgi:multidrug transporter EmrE-like cation transporter
MKTPIISMFCIFVASLLGAAGQFLYKSGAGKATGGLASYLMNPQLLGGMACYVGVMVLFITAFKLEGELSVIYPVYASTFIFAAIGAWFLYKEPIHIINVAGMGLLVSGMFLMGWKPS